MALTNAAQRGMDLLIDKGSGDSKTRLGGIRTTTVGIAAATVDITSADDTDRWQQLLAGTGIKKMTVSGGGIVKDTGPQQQALTDIIAQTKDIYTLTAPGIGTFVGVFMITDIQLQGAHDGEANFTISLESAGSITFTAEG